MTFFEEVTPDNKQFLFLNSIAPVILKKKEQLVLDNTDILTAYNGKGLKAAGRRIVCPFEIRLEDGQGLVCEKFLRLLPDRRLVSVARLEDRRVLAKLFFGRSGKRKYRREYLGVRGFVAAGVETPQILWNGKDAEASAHIVLFEYLNRAQSFEKVWLSEHNDIERTAMMKAVIGLLAGLHRAGVIQTDIHLDNILLHNGRYNIIDGGAADTYFQRRQMSIPFEKAFENLALFFAVLHPRHDRFIETAYLHYLNFFPRFAHMLFTSRLEERVRELRKWRERYLEKIMRTCSDFQCHRSWKRFISIRRSVQSQELSALIEDPEKYLEEGRILISGDFFSLSLVQIAEKRFLLRKYHINSRHQWIMNSLKGSSAAVSWFNGHLLEFLGIATPKPLALIEYRWGPLRCVSYLVNEHIDSAHAEHYFSCSSVSDPEKQVVADEIAEMLRNLQRSWVSHGQLELQSFIIRDQKPMLTKLGAMRSHRRHSSFIRAFSHDINQFECSWQKVPKCLTYFQPAIDELKKNL